MNRTAVGLVGLLAFLALASADKNKKSSEEEVCGVPSYVDKLPTDKQEELREIWSSFTDGDSCEDEREQTKKFLEALPDKLKKQVQGQGKRWRGPKFLEGASDEVRQQFRDLWHDRSIKKEDKPQKFLELAEKTLDSEHLALFKKSEKEREARRKAFQSKARAPQAKAAYDKLEKLREERMKIYDEIPESARKELRSLFWGRWHRRHHD
ncbi:hypothetical protein QR680_001019 [Steinernema hermaphroditum]|uniref:SXP/RAL-2 family protein Ani s 5-like cation-binding domain-containing protein n=1 Tax=Steinernema hermaphroditum TaxID=289476 RepID=A0AA39GXG7_9BILA|nr:hypothetical protein QR680_001019 [Steinernema hermaphroditum]